MTAARSVLVVGGGIGGMRAAVDLADAGLHVYLVERAPSLGGRVAQLGYMFPTHDCVLCRGTSDHGYGCSRPAISPVLLDHNTHPNITLLTLTEVVGSEGEVGDFHVHLRQHPRYVDPGRCINCARCAQVCPEQRVSEFQAGLSNVAAIHKSAPRSIPDSYYLIEKTSTCDTCQKCVEVCPTRAVDLRAASVDLDIHVGVVILALGFQPFDARSMPELGLGRHKNVITSMQYERLASRSGPTEGIVMRPSDGQAPKKIAWLQCVGSRDQRNAYCSSICCMYATKEAMLAIQRIPGAECHIFTMDERAFNKEYNAYYRRARDSFGIRYNRTRISEVIEDAHTGDLVLRYPGGREHGEAAMGQGAMAEEHFDLVVLATGIRPPAEAEPLAEALGIELNPYGFCATDKFNPLATSRPGVFVCGAFGSPKEMSETLLDASGAAAEAMRILRHSLGDRAFSRAEPFVVGSARPEGAVSEDAPVRVGIFLCGCSGEIDGPVDLEAVSDFASGLPGVVHVQQLDLACFFEGQTHLRDAIWEKRITRVVVGACSHRTHLALFQRMAWQAGLSASFVELVNLREHCAWAHAPDAKGATRKASEMIHMAVGRLRLAKPVRKEARQMDNAALVIGGGITGMTAALEIADSGYPVTLVEKTGALGGNMHHVYYVAEGTNPQGMLRDVVNRVVAHERISLLFHSQVVRQTGSVGDFRTLVRSEPPGMPAHQEEIRHGVTVVAVGGREGGGSQYLLGQDARVMKQSQLEELIAHQPEKVAALRQVVMIQCVQPEGGAEYCSRICCTNSIKNAIRLKMLNPGCQVAILYKDIITYGFRETYYSEARRRGVVFARYTSNDPPRVSREGQGAQARLVVAVREHVFGKVLEFAPDVLALSTSMVPVEDAPDLARVLRVPLSSEGFFLEAHLKMRPMEFPDEGMYLAGMAHYPKFIEECITHALAAAGRAITFLSRSEIQVGGNVATVDATKCTACLTCVRTCPFGVPEVRDDRIGVGGVRGAAWIDPGRCQGCGTCTAECPAKAIQLAEYQDAQLCFGIGAWSATRATAQPACK